MRPRTPVLIIAAILAAIALAPVACGVLSGLLGPPGRAMREAFGNARGTGRVDHGRLDAMLRDHVGAGGLVDYPALADRARELDAYLATLAEVELTALPRDEILALLINAYNACTLRLILDHYPLASIRDIPAARRWDDPRWRIAGHTMSLTELEHDWLRAKFVEPRIHFAINCASIGCPPLRREAYAAARLEDQLEDQARHMHEDPRHARFDAAGGTLHLTSLYAWYEGDFVQAAGSVEAFAARWLPGLRAALDRGDEPRVEFLDYDWGLNDSASR